MKRYAGFLSALALCAVLAPAASMAASFPQTINHREWDQQARINRGIRSGELTRREAGSLEREESRIRLDERYDRLRSGRLTPGERVRLQSQLNHASRNIYRDKHNGRVR